MSETAQANNEAWHRFSVELALVLGRLPASTNIVAEASGNRFAQFLMADAGLVCELVCNDDLGVEHRMTVGEEVRLHLDGWGEPRDGHHWTRFLTWPARLSAYQDLADHVVIALRDILRIGDPSELILTGWPGPTSQAPDLTQLGIAVSIASGPY
ncbi:TY-Chap domain-containing protein [Nocardia sp. R16R-3T]